MGSGPLPIQWSEHAREQIRFRGGTPEEVEQAVRTAELGRLECRLTLPFNAEWNGKRYASKIVRPIFIEEKDRIIVVTVYVYYG